MSMPIGYPATPADLLLPIPHVIHTRDDLGVGTRVQVSGAEPNSVEFCGTIVPTNRKVTKIEVNVMQDVTGGIRTVDIARLRILVFVDPPKPDQ